MLIGRFRTQQPTQAFLQKQVQQSQFSQYGA